MNTSELIEASRRHLLTHFAVNQDLRKHPKVFVRGEGIYLFDSEGNRYLDTFASLLTTICGHHRPEVAQAVQEQMAQIEFFPNYHDCTTIPPVELAAKLAELTPGDLGVSFFVGSGSEACESAIKMARQYHWERGDKQRFKVVARRQSYHGATGLGMAATGLSGFREPHEPMAPGFVHVMPPTCYRCELGFERSGCNLECLQNTRRVVEWEGPHTISALILDPVAGSNTGYPVPPNEYLPGLRQLCDEYGILLIFDEIQVGFGKTGKWFCCEHWNVVPDILCVGKGFSGGYLPLSAAITTPQIAEVFSKPGSEFRHGHTFGGHPTCCAATLANLRIIERENLVERAAQMGLYLKQQLEKLRQYPIVGDVRGIGMLLAVELVADQQTKRPWQPGGELGGFVRDWAGDNGMILRNNGDILVIAPALTMTQEEADFMVGLFDEGVAAAVKHFGI
jgi:taurine-pyruvate aminotransferase